MLSSENNEEFSLRPPGQELDIYSEWTTWFLVELIDIC